MNTLKDIGETMVSIFKGMGITLKYLGKKPVTQQYPDERWELPTRFRGFVHNDIPRCTACMLCAKDCPVDCIYIEMEGKGKDRKMSRYAIDYNKCIWCSLCTEHCPTHCITMSHDYDHAVYLRERLVYEFVDEPVIPYKEPKKPKPKPATTDASPRPSPSGSSSPAPAPSSPRPSSSGSSSPGPSSPGPGPSPSDAGDHT